MGLSWGLNGSKEGESAKTCEILRRGKNHSNGISHKKGDLCVCQLGKADCLRRLAQLFMRGVLSCAKSPCIARRMPALKAGIAASGKPYRAKPDRLPFFYLVKKYGVARSEFFASTFISQNDFLHEGMAYDIAFGQFDNRNAFDIVQYFHGLCQAASNIAC